MQNAFKKLTTALRNRRRFPVHRARPLTYRYTPVPNREAWVRQAAGLTVSAVIPVLDGGDPLQRLLQALYAQQGFKEMECIVVDSGSRDGSVELAKRLGARVVRLPDGAFNHAHARNQGAAQAKGDLLLFTVQDALPPEDTWLLEFFARMRSMGAAAATCTELFHADVDLFYQAQAWNHLRFMDLLDQDQSLLSERRGQEKQENQEGRERTDDRNDVHGRRRCSENRTASRDHIDPGGDHRGSVYQRRYRRRTFHRVRQPNMKRQLSALSACAAHQQKGDRRDRCAAERVAAGVDPTTDHIEDRPVFD